MELVLLFPGQGSQKVGMGRALSEAFPAARQLFDEVDQALGAPISRLCFEGPESELTSTENAQPALLAHGMAAWAVVRDAVGARPAAAAGHSLGEFTAYAAAGAFSLGDAARLVRRRGELMLDSGRRRPGTMAAILGLAEAAVEEACARVRADGGEVVPANYNTPEQLVISGEVAAVERAMALCKEAGAKRALRLNVSGAFHSPLMEFAAEGFWEALGQTPFSEPVFPVYSNVTGAPSSDAADARALLQRQITAPVRWTAEVRRLAADHPGALFLELGPGNVLANLVKRIVPTVATASCGTPADLDALTHLVA